MSAANKTLSIDLLYVVAHLCNIIMELCPDFSWNIQLWNLNVGDAVDNAALLDPLDESVAGAIISDRQAQRIFRLCDLDLFGTALQRLVTDMFTAPGRAIRLANSEHTTNQRTVDKIVHLFMSKDEVIKANLTA